MTWNGKRDPTRIASTAAEAGRQVFWTVIAIIVVFVFLLLCGALSLTLGGLI